MLTIATRKSPLALWQAEHVAMLVKSQLGIECQLLPRVTEGDVKLQQSLAWQGGKALFLKELQQAMVEGEANLAVHSLKDVSAIIKNQFTIASILKRDNPFDTFISFKYKSLNSLPVGAVVGTASLRRTGQILHYYPKLKVRLLRGNINSRIAKCKQGDYDAIILAQAGLERMGLQDEVPHSIIPTNISLPAVTQGIMAVECLKSNTDLIEKLNLLTCKETKICAEAERFFSRKLNSDCHSPIACYSEIEEDSITIQARVITPDGKKLLHKVTSGSLSDANCLAGDLADQMITDGALKLLSQ